MKKTQGRIGIMSDSHDNVDAIRQAVRLFKNLECECVIHAGDFVAPFAARELEELFCPVKAVFGNCDGEKEGLERTIRPFGEIQEAPLAFNQNNKRFLLLHVHFSVDKYAASGDYDVVIFGHTHKPEVRKQFETLLINPGETGGWVSGRNTVAVLDPKTLDAEIVAL